MVTSQPIDTASEMARIRRDDCGAVVGFEGNVRSPNKGSAVSHLEYEAYERAALSQFEAIAVATSQECGLADVTIVHRIGNLVPGATSFLVVVAAPHRDAAFQGCSLIVDRVKAEAAVWKTEHTLDEFDREAQSSP